MNDGREEEKKEHQWECSAREHASWQVGDAWRAIGRYLFYTWCTVLQSYNKKQMDVAAEEQRSIHLHRAQNGVKSGEIKGAEQRGEPPWSIVGSVLRFMGRLDHKRAISLPPLHGIVSKQRKEADGQQWTGRDE